MLSKKERQAINIICKGGNRLSLKLEAAKISNFIFNYLNDYPNEDLYLKNLKYPTLKMIKKYLEHYIHKTPKKIEMPLPNKDFKDCIDEWDYDFINFDIEIILELMVAANFLDINSLLDLTSAKIASLIKGKNPDEIRRILNMENDNDECDENEEQVNNDENLIE